MYWIFGDSPVSAKVVDACQPESVFLTVSLKKYGVACKPTPASVAVLANTVSWVVESTVIDVIPTLVGAVESDTMTMALFAARLVAGVAGVTKLFRAASLTVPVILETVRSEEASPARTV